MVHIAYHFPSHILMAAACIWVFKEYFCDVLSYSEVLLRYAHVDHLLLDETVASHNLRVGSSSCLQALSLVDKHSKG